MKWGTKLGKYFIINSRIETFMEKKSFRNLERCFIVTSGFYEWNK